ncbi:MAG: hypothetical protein M3421_14470 [Bacteroidota bacterium]|jgi:hypothetical protein|nr:hypothetical protein [Bacteroidota bacterium]
MLSIFSRAITSIGNETVEPFSAVVAGGFFNLIVGAGVSSSELQLESNIIPVTAK